MTNVLASCCIIYLIYAKCSFGHIENSQSMSLGHCLRNSRGVASGLLSCAGEQALHGLQKWEEAEQFALTDGLKMIRDDKAPRSLENFLDKDPMDFRSILEGASAMISHRTLEWDMKMIYPGLALRIGPSVNGPGLLEFTMDPNHERDNYEIVEEDGSTARTLTRQFIVPFLLGLKFNLVTLLPLVFGALIILSKKALFLGKLAVILSGVFGLGSIFSASGAQSPYPEYGQGSYGLNSFGYSGPNHNQHGGFHHYKDYKRLDQEASNSKTTTDKPPVDNFYKYEDQLHFRDRLDRLYNKDQYTPNRHFGWQTLTPK